MKEIYEFRIPEESAARWLRDDEGVRLSGGFVRKLTLASNSPRMLRVAEAHRHMHAEGRAFYLGWGIDRTYTSEEIDAADLFVMKIRTIFEPAGEDCGTRYDEASACPICGAGSTLASDLILECRRIPRLSAVAKTIAGEIVVSRRFRDLVESNGVHGMTFRRVVDCRTGQECRDWLRLDVQDSAVDIVSPTKIGVEPFYFGNEDLGPCPNGDTVGLNVLSEVTVKLPSAAISDIALSKQFVGSRMGLLRPERILFVAPSFQRLLLAEKIRGASFEIARVAGS
ncbi:MAG: hypothetical protein M3N13_01465 [Candidatus Eremiobacteraeota bacterium]|nr:hypothetical protein [Candidatus Eremiobacteraeota bacterium]